MIKLKLYSPAISLLAWALAWWLGATTDAVMVFFLTITGLLSLLHVHTALSLRRRHFR